MSVSAARGLICLARSTHYKAPSIQVDDSETVDQIRVICEEFETYGFRRAGGATLSCHACRRGLAPRFFRLAHALSLLFL